MITINKILTIEPSKKVWNQNEIPKTNKLTNSKDMVDQHSGIVLIEKLDK